MYGMGYLKIKNTKQAYTHFNAAVEYVLTKIKCVPGFQKVTLMKMTAIKTLAICKIWGVNSRSNI